MRYIEQILATIVLGSLVIITGISISSASPTNSKHAMKAKHKHSITHGIKGKHNDAYSQTLTKSETEDEYRVISPQDFLWFLNIPDSLRTSWDKATRKPS
jgi:hypothetical protein